jgi:hypothetical protein
MARRVINREGIMTLAPFSAASLFRIWFRWILGAVEPHACAASPYLAPDRNTPAARF